MKNFLRISTSLLIFVLERILSIANIPMPITVLYYDLSLIIENWMLLFLW